MKSINIFSLIHFPRQHLRTTGQGYEVKHTLYFFLRCSHLLEICFFLNPIFWMITLLGNMTGKLEACINRSTAWCRLHECIMSPCTSNFCLCKYDMSLNWIPLWPPYAHDHDFVYMKRFMQYAPALYQHLPFAVLFLLLCRDDFLYLMILHLYLMRGVFALLFLCLLQSLSTMCCCLLMCVELCAM